MQSPDEAPAVSSNAPLQNPLGAHPVNPDSTATSGQSEDASRRQPAASSAASAELTSAKIALKGALRHFDDFPIKGIDFVDIMPLFMDAAVHQTLHTALDLQVKEAFSAKPDVIIGLDARGFLFGPGLALRLGVAFAPVRKKGKLPGPCVTASYEKEYGTDLFQMQADAIKPGQKILIVDDIIATGGSAKAAADLVKQLKGEIVGYLFILEIPGLNGKEKLGDVPTVIMLEDA
ncbi:probable APT1 - adenine phosphoribosyltransferase [Cephalotrichum gorgonifer]|uniref:adenine phosphoribosyltransferase n=1 Tax=Cephalotrichum gorgonifer TaxID=2041049 RepID=A0AAE8MXA7_9PEZI|nr:probable APT1 - adenine phosphoribosyltransferase [Cephalotrichum gorgonifer]